jgi:hypothetical protein
MPFFRHTKGHRIFPEAGPLSRIITGFEIGDDGIRTHDLRLAKPALSQLSYIPGDGNGTYPLQHPVSRITGAKAPGWLKQPLYPDEAQVKVDVILAESLYPAWLG